MTQLNIEGSVAYNARQGFGLQEMRNIQSLLGVPLSGQWDAETVQALAQWQERSDITPDGKIWRSPSGNTWPKLEANIKGHELADLVVLLTSAGIHVLDERVAPRPWMFTPVGVVVHHTATGGTANLPTLKLAQRGRADLSGPLCQILLGRDGTAAVITEGLANHAGKGRSSVLRQVQEKRPFSPSGEPDSIGGNRWFYGVEIENDGVSERFPEVQYAAAIGIAAALCQHFGWSEQAVIGHKEWTGRKVDPSFDMDHFRQELALRLAPSERRVAAV